MARTTEYEVIHASLYMRVNGNLQEVKAGTMLPLSKDKAKDLIRRGFVKEVTTKQVIDKTESK